MQVFRALLENVAGEMGAKMSAMDNATRNAGEMINKRRPTTVSARLRSLKELIEIISGAGSALRLRKEGKGIMAKAATPSTTAAVKKPTAVKAAEKPAAAAKTVAAKKAPASQGCRYGNGRNWQGNPGRRYVVDGFLRQGPARRRS